ncbi:MAG TPA: hypothetical protein PKE30_15910 [Niabella sp.]|nr:hypothetical protein [Niabella sp.]
MKPYKINFLTLCITAAVLVFSCKKNETQPIPCVSEFFYEGGVYRIDTTKIIAPSYKEGQDVPGVFKATRAGLIINASTGEIDVENSMPGNYTIRKIMIDNPSCGNRIALGYVTILDRPKPPVILHTADHMTGWNFAGTAKLDTEDKKEGSASIKNTGSGLLVSQFDLNPPIDIETTKDMGLLKFWFYISNPTAITNGQFELTSGGGPDKNELTWHLPGAVQLQAGWNHITLRLIDAEVTNGVADLSQINFFRCYIFPSGTITVGFDDFKVYHGQE